MIDKARRKELVGEYKRTHPEAGVYRLVNMCSGKALLGSSPNLASMRNKLAFAKSTNSPGALDYRLREDIKQYGLDAFSLEIVDVLDIRPEMTADQIRDDLTALEDLWREQQNPALGY